jgi:hypothetical protein
MSLSAWGQATTSLHGLVTDKSGAVVPHATVTINNDATHFARTTRTGSDGIYVFPSVQPGTYAVSVQADGFRTFKQVAVPLQVNLPATLNVQMQVGAVAETIEVTGQAPELNTTDASVGNTMGSNAIQNLPMRAESMPLLLSFQPGVVFNGQNKLEDSYDTRAGSVNGERSDQNNITLDGVSDNNEFAGYAFTGVLPTTPFSTQEFRVTTSNYDATEGRSAGAQITMVTKSGTNKFHGNLYEFNRNTLGEANDWFLKQAQVTAGQPNRPEKLIRNVFGGDVGGPIIQNRLFFFVNYEGHRVSQAQSVIRNIPSNTLRDGIIQYACADATQCPGGSVTGVSGTSYAVAPGYYALGPSQLASMDPLGIGPSSVALAYFKTFPSPNASAVVDAPNFAGYRFAAPVKNTDNWYIGRLDYNLTSNGNHTLFLRGTVVDDRDDTSAPFLPGAPPESSNVDLSKGLVAGYTAVFGPNWVNSFRYGLTRQSLGVSGNSTQPWVYMRDMDQGVTRSSGAVVPVHNFIDNVSWHKGSHNFQFGANLLLVRRSDYTYGQSFSDALTNADWVAEGGFAGTESALDPAASGYPAVGSAHSYDFPLAAMMGMASEVDARYNYSVASLTSATPIAQGTPVPRNWATDTYNLFVQDTWQARRNLSITYGLNYQLMTPITETNGQQVEPNINMGQWFEQRRTNMLQGIGSNQDALINFAPAGSAWGKAGMYGAQTRNFAPRIGLAWSPQPSWSWLKTLVGDNQTSIRAGFGMYYDNFGPALAMRYDQSGSFGLSSLLENPAASLTIADVPRITSMNSIPTTDNSGNPIMQPAPASNFPVAFPVGAEGIATGIDQSLKTPYSYAINLSIQRELPGNMVLDVGYVGHLGHRNLALDDIATPLDMVDPSTGVDYFSATQALAKLYRQGVPMSQITAQMVGPTASYWTNMFVQPSSAYSSCATGATNQLQAAYGWMSCFPGNETLGLWEMDVRNHTPLPVGGENSYYNSQYSSLWAWRSMTNSNYHALEVSLRKQASHGVMFGFNYTYSHSLDTASFSERSVHFLTDSIINPWNPHQMYGPSDFDLRHQINGYWVAELPFGTGKLLAHDAGRAVNGLIGGWQLAGTTRWTSGFPFSVFMGYVWPTNWDEMGWANQVAPISTGTTIVDGTPNVFKDPTAASKAFDYAFPGQSGARNNIRGEGFVDSDMSLSKTWKVTEKQNVQFRWQVFNVFNTHRFDVQSIQDEQDAGGFGSYTGLLTSPRTMEFGLVYTF